MCKRKTIFILILLTLKVLHSNGQTNDAQLRSGIKLNYKLNSKFTAHLESELRLNENISEIGLSFTELSLDYKINKMFEVSSGFRYFAKRINDDLSSNHFRFNLDFLAKKSYYLFIFMLRTRLIIEYKDILSSTDGYIPSCKWQNKAEVKYNFTKKIKPYFYIESYTALSTNSKYTQVFDITKMKYCIGSEYKINKHNSVELYYLIEKEFHKKNPYNNFIIGIRYSYSF